MDGENGDFPHSENGYEPDDENEDDLIGEDDEIVEYIEDDDIPLGGEAMDGMSNGDSEPIGEETIIDPGPDLAAVTFRNHSQNVFCVDLSADGKVASGGEDDKAFVWDGLSGQILLECAGHRDSVTWVKFNAKSTLLATADMSGLIRVWNTADFSMLTELDLESDLEWITWHPAADIIFAGTGDGSIWMRLVQSENCKVFAGIGSPCTTGVLIADGRRLIAGYASGTTKIWDLKSGESASISGIGSDSTSPITAMDSSPGDPTAAIGSEDGMVRIINTESGKILATVAAPAIAKSSDDDSESQDLQSIESVKLGASSSILVAGTVSGSLLVWEMGSMALRHHLKHPLGVVKVLWMDDNTVVSACLDGRLRLWDVRDGKGKFEWTGHSGGILDFAFRDCSRIVTASADNTCKVFQAEIST